MIFCQKQSHIIDEPVQNYKEVLQAIGGYIPNEKQRWLFRTQCIFSQRMLWGSGIITELGGEKKPTV